MTLETEDMPRLNKQLQAVYDIMRDGNWRTLPELRYHVKATTQSLSARLRDFRKPKFGGFLVERRKIGGLFEYRLDTERRDPATRTPNFHLTPEEARKVYVALSSCSITAGTEAIRQRLKEFIGA